MTHPRTFAAAIALSVVFIDGHSGAQTVRCTTWNLEANLKSIRDPANLTVGQTLVIP